MGGARGRSGPPPDPMALHRARDSSEWWTLPSQGRTEPAPRWGLTEPSERELEVWGVLWAKPQAVAWERLGLDYEVALYVRSFVEAEIPLSCTPVRTLVKQLGESLGLTIPGLLRNRWKIGDVETRPTGRKTSGAMGARDRLKVVDGGGA